MGACFIHRLLGSPYRGGCDGATACGSLTSTQKLLLSPQDFHQRLWIEQLCNTRGHLSCPSSNQAGPCFQGQMSEQYGHRQKLISQYRELFLNDIESQVYQCPAHL